MVLEVAEFKIRQGYAEAFVTGVEKSLPLFKAATGFRNLRLVRSIEAPDTFRLLIHWERLEDHTEGFRNSPAFGQWRANVGEFLAEPPRVDHNSECVST
jgi:quinol monooxygenase YgiN